MEASHPVLQRLAVARAARDFGLPPDELDPLTLRHAGSLEAFTEAVAAAVLSRSALRAAGDA